MATTELVGYAVTACAYMGPDEPYETARAVVSPEAFDHIEYVLPNVVVMLASTLELRAPDRSTWTWWADPMRSFR